MRFDRGVSAMGQIGMLPRLCQAGWRTCGGEHRAMAEPGFPINTASVIFRYLANAAMVHPDSRHGRQVRKRRSGEQPLWHCVWRCCNRRVACAQ